MTLMPKEAQRAVVPAAQVSVRGFVRGGVSVNLQGPRQKRLRLLSARRGYIVRGENPAAASQEATG